VIAEFVAAWGADLITTLDPHHSVTDAFATFAALTGDVGAALAAWPDHPVANRHLATASNFWLHDLVHDDNPLSGSLRLGLEQLVLVAHRPQLRQVAARRPLQQHDVIPKVAAIPDRLRP